MKQLLFLFLASITFTMCNSDDDGKVYCPEPIYVWCENYDPCFERRHPVSASFKTSAGYLFSDPSFFWETDTFINPSEVWFEALDSTASSYQWKIGTDDRDFTEPKFSLQFPNYSSDYSIEVTLITERKIDSSCVSDPQILRDTQSREIFFIHEDSIPFLGIYEGFLEDTPGDLYEIEIRIDKTSFFDELVVYNILQQGCSLQLDLSYLFFKRFGFTGIESGGFKEDCDQFSFEGYNQVSINFGQASLDPSGTELEIEFFMNKIDDSQQQPNEIGVPKKFIGKKIHQ